MKTFDNKTVLITGASAGIGSALAVEFGRLGANLVLTARREDRLQALASRLNQEGHSTLAVKCDVTQDGDLDRAVGEAVKKFGKLDVVVANAGFGVAKDLERLSVEDYRRQFETNIFGVLRTVYASLTELKKTRGVLVLIGSVNGYVSLPGGSAYAMSKFAIHALAQSLTYELKPYGISVVLIAPGFVVSEIQRVDNRGIFHPDAQDFTPSWLRMPTEKAARKIVSAVAKRKKEQVITGHGKVLVFIRRHFPWVLSFFLNRGLSTRQEP